MQIKMKNEEALRRYEFLDAIDKASPQQGMLGFGMAYNKDKLLTAVQVYAKTKDEYVKKYREQVDWSDDDPKKVKDEKTKELNKLLNEDDELTKIANTELDVDVLKVTAEVMYSGTLKSSEMVYLLWMVDDGTKEAK